MSTHVESLAFKVWRDHITNMIQAASFDYNRDNSDILHRIQDKLAHFEDKLLELKEVTTILEIGLWKMKINALSLRGDATHNQKKSRQMNQVLDNNAV
jgi:hypothetical protein